MGLLSTARQVQAEVMPAPREQLAPVGSGRHQSASASMLR